VKEDTGEEVSYKCKESELGDLMDKVCKEMLGHWSLQQATLEEVFLNVSKKY
jgi:hypothetical protein